MNTSLKRNSPLKRNPLLNDRDIQEALQEIKEKAGKQKIMLVGGAALHFYGSDRLTGDLDIVSLAPIAGLRNESALSIGGYTSHTSKGVEVDLIIPERKITRLYTDALLNAKNLPECPIPVISLEHILVMKMQAHRRKDEVDVVNIFNLSGFDAQKAKALVKKFLGEYALHDFETYQWEASRSR